MIQPGDIILADIGSIAGLRNIAVDVLERAEGVERKAKKVRADV